MYKKIFCLISFAFMIAASNDASADLVAHWKLDDGSGTIAKDFVGENDGTLIGDTAWAAGKLGGALRFDGNGDYVNCGNNSVFNPTGSFSIAFWANITQWTTAWAEAFLGKGGDNDRGGWCVRRGSGTSLCFTVAGVNSGTGGWFGNAAPAQNEWIHIACVYDQAGGTAAIYINGVLDSSFTVSGNAATNNAPLLLGTRGNTAGTGPDTWGSSYYGGMLDDVRFYNHALSAVEVAGSMIGISPGFAANPLPKTDAVDIVRDQILSWTPGKFANTHDVYFGTDFEDVNQATLSNNLGVTVTEGLDVNSYDPGILDFGMTYYWRVDEVNAPPSNTVFKGTVWSFTIEPYSYQIPAENITASSLGSSEDSDPNQTINESGLDLNNMDLHSKITGDMWISTDDVNDIWIRYDFDKVYKLHEMLVWNYNLGFYLNAGFKAVTVEYSGDGQTWTALADVPEFAKGTGKDSYLYNTVVDFNGVTAQSVRLTANSNWSDGAIPNVGLSEVRFMYIPVWAREPYPEDEASDIPLDVTLSWRAGREAAEHKVYLSQDEQSVADGIAAVSTVSQPDRGPLSLDINRTYYWRVDEVNNSEIPSVWAGDIWSFSTPSNILIDGFEVGYDNTDANAVWNTWIDGYGNESVNGGLIGYEFPGPYLSTTNHSGGHSVPLRYNNTTAGYSETTAQAVDLPIGTTDWRTGNPDTFVIWFLGDVNNAVTDRLYMKLNNTKKIYDVNAADISSTIWKKWEINLTTLGVNLSNVSSITIGVERAGTTGGSGILYLDDIQLTLSTPPVENAVSIVNPSFEANGNANGTPSGWEGNNISGGVGTSAGSVSTTDGGYYLWQGNGNYIYQTTNEVIATADLTYTLQVDVRNSWLADPKIILYYEDAGNRIELGSTTLPSNGNSWPAPVTMEVTAVTTAASVGKKLGVELTISNYPGNRWSHYDNVRLVQIE